MADLEYDVLRVEAGYTGLPDTLRNYQLGFESDSSYRMLHKLGSGTGVHWTPDEYRPSENATGVGYGNASYPSLDSVAEVLDYLLKPELTINSFTSDVADGLKGATYSNYTFT